MTKVDIPFPVDGYIQHRANLLAAAVEPLHMYAIPIVISGGIWLRLVGDVSVAIKLAPHVTEVYTMPNVEMPQEVRRHLVRAGFDLDFPDEMPESERARILWILYVPLAWPHPDVNRVDERPAYVDPMLARASEITRLLREAGFPVREVQQRINSWIVISSNPITAIPITAAPELEVWVMRGSHLSDEVRQVLQPYFQYRVEYCSTPAESAYAVLNPDIESIVVPSVLDAEPAHPFENLSFLWIGVGILLLVLFATNLGLVFYSLKQQNEIHVLSSQSMCRPHSATFDTSQENLTVLVTDCGKGTYLVQGWQNGGGYQAVFTKGTQPFALFNRQLSLMNCPPGETAPMQGMVCGLSQ